MKFSKKIVSAIVLLNVAFTVAILIVFWHTSSEPTALVGCWFTFTTGELWALASIRKTKAKEGAKKDETKINE